MERVCLCPSVERPLRGYELLSDVQASWNKDKLVNMFVLRWTPLAASLSLEVRRLILGFRTGFDGAAGCSLQFAYSRRIRRVGEQTRQMEQEVVAASRPRLVAIQTRQRKRYSQIRWITCPDDAFQGRDEVFLCTLSNFDAYSVTRAYKAPKPFAFAIKSTDNLSFFENTADYLHMFSCQARDGQKWIEKILIARVSGEPLRSMRSD